MSSGGVKMNSAEAEDASMWWGHWRMAWEVVHRPGNFYRNLDPSSDWRTPLFFVFILSAVGAFCAGTAFLLVNFIPVLTTPNVHVDSFLFPALFGVVLFIILLPFLQIMIFFAFSGLVWLIQSTAYFEKQRIRVVGMACCYPFGVAAFLLPCVYVISMVLLHQLIEVRNGFQIQRFNDYSQMATIPVFVWLFTVSAYGFSILSGRPLRKALTAQLLPLFVVGVVSCSYESCLLFIHSKSEDSDKDAKAIYDAAMRGMRIEDYGYAQKALKTYIRFFYNESDIENAWFQLAECRYRMAMRWKKPIVPGAPYNEQKFPRLVAAAREAYEDFVKSLENCPDASGNAKTRNEMAESALLRIAECYELEENPEQALETYREFTARFPSSQHIKSVSDSILRMSNQVTEVF